MDFTNGEFKAFIKNPDIQLKEKSILFEAYELLPKSKKQIIIDNLKKGKGLIFKALITMEKEFNKSFPREQKDMDN